MQLDAEEASGQPSIFYHKLTASIITKLSNVSLAGIENLTRQPIYP